jgi:hypothetical protein
MTHEARAVLGPTRVPNVEVRLYKDHSTFTKAVRHFNFAPGDSGGFYDGPRKTIHSYRKNNAFRSILHEHVHALTAVRFADLNYRRYKKKGWPVWFEEGIAEWMSAVLIHKSGKNVRLDRDDPVAYNHLTRPDGEVALPIPLSRLLYLNHKRFRGDDSAKLYAMSLAVVETIMDRPEIARSMVERLTSGQSPVEAVRRLVQELGGMTNLERMVRKKVEQSRAQTWRNTKIYGHPDDTIWNWIPSGPGAMILNERIQLIQPTESTTSTLFKRPIPRTDRIRATTSCMLGVGAGSLVLIGQDDTGKGRQIELHFTRTFATALVISDTGQRIGTIHQIEIPAAGGEISIDFLGGRRGGRVLFNHTQQVTLESGPLSYIAIGLEVQSGKLDCAPIHVSGGRSVDR